MNQIFPTDPFGFSAISFLFPVFIFFVIIIFCLLWIPRRCFSAIGTDVNPGTLVSRPRRSELLKVLTDPSQVFALGGEEILGTA